MDTSIEVINPDLQKEVLTVQENAKTFSVINTPEQAEEAGKFFKYIKDVMKKADEFFDPTIKRTNEAHKEAVKMKKTAVTPLEQAVRIVSPAIAKYQFDVQEKARKDQEKLNKEAEKKGFSAPAVAPAPPKIDGISTRESWTAEVESFPDLVKAVCARKVPLMALSPNESFLKQQARAMKDQLNYPGVKVKKIVSAVNR